MSALTDAERIAALESECALLYASLKQADEKNDLLEKALREIVSGDPFKQSSAGVIARAALIAAGVMR